MARIFAAISKLNQELEVNDHMLQLQVRESTPLLFGFVSARRGKCYVNV